MNWLAHVFLSDDDIEFQLGNLLADVVRGPELESMSPQFIRGVQRHKAIDSFTDAHPAVRRSRLRLGPEHRRFSGVLMDVFYDYFLATHWQSYSTVSLEEFTAAFYANATGSNVHLPAPAQLLVDRIVGYDLLGQYRNVHGVEQSLRRLSQRLAVRWKRDFALESSVPVLLANETALAGDFAEFFPQVQLLAQDPGRNRSL
ncbi:MAG: ACP phosphodiesterase [Steroidobacteraceae bacterium]